MSWRTVIISKRAKLDFKLDSMVVRGEEETHRINLSEISTLVIENTAVSLTAYLLCELVKRKIKVIFCDEKRNPNAELVSYYGSHDTSGCVRAQAGWKEDTKKTVWTLIVKDKIQKQKELMQFIGCENSCLLDDYLEEMILNDETNREGHAAKVYFNGLFGLGFSRSQATPINAALNYGYAILLSAFNREIVACGYITQIGINHRNVFNPFNLGSDLMEPFRPLVDKIVLDLKPEQFEMEEKKTVIGLLNQKVEIAEKKQFINNAIAIYVKSVLDALTEDDPSLLKVYKNEL